MNGLLKNKMEAVTTIERIVISNKSAFFNLKIMYKSVITNAGSILMYNGNSDSPLAFQKI